MSSRTTRHRRTNAQLARTRDDLLAIVKADPPMTVRQIYYQAVTQGIVEKTESAYKNTVCRLLAQMRREGQLPYDHIADNTRWQRKPATHASITDALRRTTEFYRRDLWLTQDAYVEIWVEKDALAGVFLDVTADWHVPLMVSKGFASLTYLYEAAQAIKSADKPAYLYYFGDRDPSGVHIDRSIESQLRKLAPDVEITFERVAVTPEQIDTLNLPTRPTKGSDSRAKGFDGESVEVDAIQPGVLRSMVSDCITKHIDYGALHRLRRVEELERETLNRFLGLDIDELNQAADAAGL